MTKKALYIGINDYPGTANDLKCCVNDANDWSVELGKRSFAVTRMLNGQATKATMVTAIRDLSGSARSGNTLLFTYSGHGTWAPNSSGDELDGRDEALCLYDIGTNGPLLDDEIGTLFRSAGTGVHILLTSDSCHSGSMIRGREDDLDAGKTRARFMPLSDWMSKGELPPTGAAAPRVVSGIKRTGGDPLLAGCKDTEYSFDTSFQG